MDIKTFWRAGCFILHLLKNQLTRKLELDEMDTIRILFWSFIKTANNYSGYHWISNIFIVNNLKLNFSSNEIRFGTIQSNVGK